MEGGEKHPRQTSFMTVSPIPFGFRKTMLVRHQKMFKTEAVHGVLYPALEFAHATGRTMSHSNQNVLVSQTLS